MKAAASETRNTLLGILADGQSHSGEDLGQVLGISRTAVANHIKGLGELGLDIFSVRGKGYQLSAPLDLLASDKILHHARLFNDVPIEVVNIIGSTNDFLKDQPGSRRNGQVVLAEAQTAGRGRQGRTWVSPFGASLYMSMYWQFPGGYQSLQGLSLAIGVAVSRTLSAIGIKDAQLKWPNDVFLAGKKVAGVLVEVEGQIGGACECIIGIGLNVRLPSNVDSIDRPWTDLHKHTGETICRNQLAGYLLDNLVAVLDEFTSLGLTPFLADWRTRDFYANQSVTLLMGSKEIKGICMGIDDSGALLLKQGEQLSSYQGGEISVRPIG